MKLSEWAAVAEVMGAIGIIATLIFVGTEIQQNTEAIRTSTVQAIADQDSTLSLTLATDDKLADLFAMLADDPEAYRDQTKMSRADRGRIGFAIRAALRRVENIYLHVQAGVLEPEALDRIGYGFYQSSFARWYWRNARDGFDSEFADFFDLKLAATARSE
jgi:hypothetical protein